MLDFIQSLARFIQQRVAPMPLLVLLVLVGSVPAYAEDAGAKTAEFNIGELQLADALSQFGAQSGLQVVYSPDVASGLESKPLSGRLTAEAALRQLLAGTGVTWSYVNGDTVVLKRAEAKKEPAPAEKERSESSTTSPISQKPSEKLEEIIVTASTRLDRSDVPTPTTIVSAEMLQEGARPNYVAVLNDLPQFRASWSPQITGGSFTAGSYTVDLRGLGSSRTLVLLDGRRFVSGYSTGLVGPDLAVIPSVLVDHIDVVTGSASAAWGSSAVAGVVNVAIDEKLQGFRLGVRGGTSSRDDTEEKQIEFAAGSAFAGGRGRAIFGVEFVDNEGARPKTARHNVGRWAAVTNPNAANGQAALTFAPDVGVATASLGGLILTGVNRNMAFEPNGTLRPFDLGRVTGTTSIGGEAPSVDDFSYLSAPSTRYSAIGRVAYDFTEQLTATIELLHSHVYNEYPLRPDPSPGNITIQIENAFLPAAVRDQMTTAGETSFTMGRYNADFALMHNDYSRETSQATIGLSGRLFDRWRWNAYYSHGLFEEDVDLSHQRITANFANAVDAVVSPVTGQPVCRVSLSNPSSTCVPINLFGEGNPSVAAQSYVLGTAMERLHQTLDAGGLTLRGEPLELSAGPVSLAFGIEGRREEIDQKRGPLDQTGALAFFNFQPIQGDSSTKEAFVETLVPVVSERPMLQRLQFNGAARITDDPTGSIWSWKLGLINDVTDSFRVRFTRSRDIRAPNLIEFYSPQIFSNTNISDPRTGSTYLIRAFSGGNPLLKPEASDTTTFGFTFNPERLRGFTISADYFDIDIENAIATINAQTIINLCEQGNGTACGAITRGQDGLIVSTAANQLNFTKLTTSGVDATASYAMSLKNGAHINLRSSLTWVTDYRTDNGLIVQDLLGSQGTIAQGVPKVSANTAVSYEQGALQLTVRNRFLSAGKNIKLLSIQNNDIPEYLYWDVGANWKLRVGSDNAVEIFANANNLFDKEPPVASQFSPYYDVIGRYFSLGARARF